MYECERVRLKKPECCEKCLYYRPGWKYRTCYHVFCPFHLMENTLREKPLKFPDFPPTEVVRMNGI